MKNSNKTQLWLIAVGVCVVAIVGILTYLQQNNGISLSPFPTILPPGTGQPGTVACQAGCDAARTTCNSDAREVLSGCEARADATLESDEKTCYDQNKVRGLSECLLIKSCQECVYGPSIPLDTHLSFTGSGGIYGDYLKNKAQCNTEHTAAIEQCSTNYKTCLTNCNKKPGVPG